jgi:hypothetical protein
LFSVAKVPALLRLSVSVPAENIRLLLSHDAVYFEIPTLDCVVGPMPMPIYIPHLDSSSSVAGHCNREKINFSFCGTLSTIISQPSSAL